MPRSATARLPPLPPSNSPEASRFTTRASGFPVKKDRFIIGRGKQSSDLTIKDPNVSRQHAMIEFLNGQYYMVDMGSTNGVEYNGQRIPRKAIAEGDLVQGLRPRALVLVSLTNAGRGGQRSPAVLGLPAGARYDFRADAWQSPAPACAVQCRRGVERCARLRAMDQTRRRSIASSHPKRGDRPERGAAYTRADGRSPRRGSALKGARLPLYAAARGPGCAGRWLLIGPLAWVCESVVRLSSEPPLEPVEPQLLEDGLPHRYYFVGPDGSLGYKSLSLAEEGVPDAELEPGFAIAIRQVANRNPGDPFGLTTHGLWVPMRDLGAARPAMFRGTELTGSLAVAWVATDETKVYEKPQGKLLPGQRIARFEELSVLETQRRGGRRWFRIGERRWTNDRDVRAPTAAEPPSDLRPAERWIDIDIENQVLTAYEGERPVFATLVSTGKGRDKDPEATPKGEHRIWVKLISTDMDNLEDEEASRYYAMQSVPWVMFFEKGFGLHGTFWHRSFGNVRSHGCVNLTPLDAQRLFRWTSPRLPAGWAAVLPTDYERGTRIRVR